MGIFDRFKKKQSGYSAKQIKEIQANQLTMHTKAMESIQKAAENISANMQSFKTFPPDFYTTGKKQGPYAGLFSSTNDIARMRSRQTVNISPIAQSMVGTLNTFTVGSGLDLEAQPAYRLIPQAISWDATKKKEWSITTELRYKLWAKKKDISYQEDMNRYQQEQVIFNRLLVDGEYFELYRYSNMTKKNPFTIQLINAEDVRTPSGSVVANGNSEQNGIEYDAKGVAVAYHIFDYSTYKTTRVLKKGLRSGRIFVNHVKLGSNRRGIGIIAPIISELMKLGDYQVLELQAAVVNALYAVWVETPVGEVSMPTLTGGIGDTSTQSVTAGIGPDDWQKDRENLNYSEGGLVIDSLPGGYKVNSHDTKRPNVNFGAFSDQVSTSLSASIGLPVSVIKKVFKNNYSSSRAELILAWYEIEKYRANQSMTNDLVYKMWLWGEVAIGRIEAPGFSESEDMRDAWCNAQWNGNQRPDIDPLKSVNAHILEQNRGFRTGKKITSERGGGDYEENLSRVGDELRQVAANQEPLKNVDINLIDQ